MFFDSPPEEKAWTWETEGKPEVKSLSGYDSLVGFLQQSPDNWDLSFYVLIQYYKRCAPFADAVDRISEAFSEMPIHVKDLRTNKFVPHPVLELLAYPNDSMSQEDFLKQFCGMFAITGNPFLEMLGSFRRPPLALDVLSPVSVNIEPDRVGDIGTIKFNTEFNLTQYTADIVQRRKRYRKGNDLEVWPAFAFNPDRGSRQFFGCPWAKALYYDIEQYISSGQHNKSLLQNGARPGGSFTTQFEEPLTDEQFKRLQDQIDVYYSGANNAGRPLLMEHAKYEEHIVNNRDMDYKTLSVNATSSIYRKFKIPLAMVLAESMTYNNYSTAQVAFYDNAVLPIANFLYGQLGNALLYRYGDDWKRYQITYDMTEIPALKLRQHEDLKVKASIGANTVNELRAAMGDDPIPDGDVIPNINTVTSTDDNDSDDDNPDE